MMRAVVDDLAHIDRAGMTSNVSGGGAAKNLSFSTGPRSPALTVYGQAFAATTDKGRGIVVWKPDGSVTTPRAMYFCHGHALGTHALWGYTVFSDSVLLVLEDEYNFIGFDTKLTMELAAGDVAAWFGTLTPAAQTIAEPKVVIEHTALVINPIAAGGIDVSTKNGWAELQTCKLQAVKAVYGPIVGLYRRKPVAAATR
jgi:hypothetical protein